MTAQSASPIKLPQVCGAQRLNDLFRVCEQIRGSRGCVVLDATDTEFFDPLGIAVLGASLEPLVGIREVRMDWLKSSVGSYLSRMDVLNRCAIQGVEVGPFQRNDLGNSLVELTKVCFEPEVDEAADRLAAAVAGKLIHTEGIEPNETNSGQFEAFRYPLRYALSELLLNALSHAKREGRQSAAVWVAAQFYAKSGSCVWQWSTTAAACWRR